MRAALILSSAALGIWMAFAVSPLPFSPAGDGGRARSSSGHFDLAQNQGTPTPAPTPKYRSLPFGGAGQN